MTFSWVEPGVAAKGVVDRGFEVVRGTRKIPGVLWTPEGAVTVPALVLLGHGAGGTKRQGYLVSMARRLVRHQGFAAAAIDGPVHGDRRDDDEADSVTMQRDFGLVWHDDPAMTDEMVADWHTVLDELQSPELLGAVPVGWWGLSLGTIIGLPVVAADSRISVAVLGLVGLTGPTKERLRADAGNVRCPVLFLVQWEDELFKRDRVFDLFAALAPRDKRMHANPGLHGEVPAEEFDASEAFLARALLGPPG